MIPWRTAQDVVSDYGAPILAAPLMLLSLLILYGILGEVDTRMLGYMRVLGLSEAAWWGAFWVEAVACGLVAALLMLLTGMAFSLPLFTQTSALVLLLNLWAFGLSCVAVACLVGVVARSYGTAPQLASPGLGSELLSPCARARSGSPGQLALLLLLPRRPRPPRPPQHPHGAGKCHRLELDRQRRRVAHHL